MIKEKPLVSIITPSYNQGRFIEDCILSIKNQTYANIEHIIVDAKSNDNTIEVIKTYENKYNLKWISEKDKGQADAINKGYAIAKGDIVTWLNSDDFYLHVHVIEEIVDLFHKFTNVDVITGGGYYVDEAGKYITPLKDHVDKISLEHIKIADYILQPATFIKATMNDMVKIDISYTYTFDWLYFLNMFEKGANFLAIQNYFAAYRVYGVNKTALDNADRKLEIAHMALRNFGSSSLQTWFCYFIFSLYKISESIPFIGILCKPCKPFAKIINSIVYKISNGKYYSC